MIAVVGCSSTGSLTVFAASSLTEAFAELATAFEEWHPSVSVTFNFAGSQQLRTQLEHGAKADVFASADPEQMEAAMAAGLLLDQPTNFASNRLVVIVPLQEALDERADEAVQNLRDLAQRGIKLVLALPEVPVGGYTRIILEKMGADPEFGPEYVERVLANVVSQEINVRHVARKVDLGEADAGIVYQTDVMAASLSRRVRVIPIPERFGVVASYPIARLKEAKRPELAEAFVQFIRSEQGQRILQKHHFGPAVPSSLSSRSTRAGQPPLPWGARIEARGVVPIPPSHHQGGSSDEPYS